MSFVSEWKFNMLHHGDGTALVWPLLLASSVARLYRPRRMNPSHSLRQESGREHKPSVPPESFSGVHSIYHSVTRRFNFSLHPPVDPKVSFFFSLVASTFVLHLLACITPQPFSQHSEYHAGLRLQFLCPCL